jgi:acyl-CoA synthetase (AMP-forming)/AMP-acid ligase II
MNIAMALEMAADCYPDRIAVTSGGKSLTYSQVLALARGAGRVIRDSGCKYVGLLDINSLAVPVAIFASAYAAVPYVPMNYRLTKPELEELLGRISPAFLIADQAYVGQLALPEGLQIVSKDEFLARASAADGSELQAEEGAGTAIQLFTSGTTGKPKAAVLRHDNLMSYILGTVEFGAAAEDDAVLISVPPYHIAGISAVLSSTYACRRMVQLPNFDAAAWLQLCREQNVSNAFVVPTVLSRVIDHIEAGGQEPELPALKAIAYGGGKMPLAVIEKAMALFPNTGFTNAYGLTETSSTICILDPDDHRAGAASADPAVRKRLNSVGKPISTVEVEIRDEDGKPLSAGQAGEIYVRGDQVAGEYLGLGSMLDANGWFPTRDRGYLDSYGFLYLDGRADDVIVRGGENISPGEIEDVLLTHPAVLDAAIVAVPDQEWGEAVGAAVVLKDGATATSTELQDWVKNRLRSSRVPTAVMFKDQLPYNEMGKILRRVVKQELTASLDH